MGMSILTPSFKAAGNISPSRFVKITGTLQVSECSVLGERSFGISQEALKDTPIPGASTTLAAAAGDDVGVFGPGETCLLQVSAAVTAGALLRPTVNGRAVATTTAGENYGAIALDSQATVDGKVLVFIQSGKV